MADLPSPSRMSRLVGPIVQLREGEATTALLMFAYSFLAMTSYNIVKPITRSEFIASLGADNLPWVQFGAGVIIGLIMQGYSKAIALVPRRWTIPVTQAGMVVLLLAFRVMFAAFGPKWVSVGFYVFALILGVLLTSQFWTLANDVYDPRQAKRIFGFIGGGSSLGGATGAALTSYLVEGLGAQNMLLASAGIMALCFAIVMAIVKREGKAGTSGPAKADDEGVGGGEALKLLRSSKHLQIIAAVIAFAAIGAAIIEQQLNMAAAEAKGQANPDAIAAFLAQITVYLSIIGFVIQVGVTSRLHRYLGIGFALLVLPVSLGTTAVLILLNRGLWTAGVARVMDTSLRYTVDKTSREVLFLPLPADLKYRAKPFIDVTVDRLSKGMGALLILVLIKNWGLGLTWQQLSYASLTMMGLWVFAAVRARREYLSTFRRSIERQDVLGSDVRSDAADLSSIETLVTALAHSEPRRVLYAIDLLESMDKRALITPLLIWHEGADVRARALRVAEATGPEGAERWLPGVQRALTDTDGQVRVAAVGALAAIRGEAASTVMRPYLSSQDPALVIAAAAALAGSATEADVDDAEATLRRYALDARDQSAALRLQVARALGEVRNPRFRPLLVPMMHDAHFDVAQAAIDSAGALGADDFLFVAPLVSLLRNRRLKSSARHVLVGYGESVIPLLAYFMLDPDEDVWVRRHVPATLAQLPSAASIEALLKALDDSDGFLRFNAMTALAHIRGARPALTIDSVAISRHVQRAAMRAFDALTLHHNLFVAGDLDRGSLLSQALEEKRQRASDRMFRLLGLVHPANDIAAVRHTLAVKDTRLRSSAIEYLDNVLTGDVRKRVMLLVEDMPPEERIRKGNTLYRTRTRDREDTLAQLLHDDDQTVAASAILLVESQGLWALAGDIEHILEHRTASDWHVFEAASWALAAHRLKADRRKALWQEPLPAVELADRLRTLPVFHFTSIDELFRIASLGRQVRHEAGRVLFDHDATPRTVEFLLEGDVASVDASGNRRDITAPAAVAFEEVLEGAPMGATTTAVNPVISLSLSTDEFLGLLSENVQLAEGIFRLLMADRPGWHTVVHGQVSEELARKAATGLQPVDRVLLLQANPLLSHATAAQLLRVSAIARPVPLKAGVDPMAGGTGAAILVLLNGTLRVERPDAGVQTATVGDIVGIYETLCGAPLNATTTVTTDGAALRLDRSDVFDLLADHTDLLQGMFSGMMRAAAPDAAPSA